MNLQYFMLLYFALGMVGWLIAPICLISYGVLQAKSTEKIGLKNGCIIYSLSFFSFALRTYIAPFLDKGLNFQLSSVLLLMLVLLLGSIVLNLKWLIAEFKKGDSKSKAFIRFGLFLLILSFPYFLVLFSNFKLALSTV